MNMQLVNEVTKSQLKQDVPAIRPGDTVKVHVKIKEGDKSRIQVFEGLVIVKQGVESMNPSSCVRFPIRSV